MSSSEFSIDSSPSGEIVSSSTDDMKFELTVVLQMPKFSRGYTESDILPVIENHINLKDILALGRLQHPNEWNLIVSTPLVREKLLSIGHTTIKNKKCVIKPMLESEVRGRVHWLPSEIKDSDIIQVLKRFGEVSRFEKEKIGNESNLQLSNIRSFSLFLKKDILKDDVPHFISVHKYTGLLIIKGRDPMCLGCKQVGHRKQQCGKDVDAKTNKNNNRVKSVTNEMENISSKTQKLKKVKQNCPPQDTPSYSTGSNNTAGPTASAFQAAANSSVKKKSKRKKGKSQGNSIQSATQPEANESECKEVLGNTLNAVSSSVGTKIDESNPMKSNANMRENVNGVVDEVKNLMTALSEKLSLALSNVGEVANNSKLEASASENLVSVNKKKTKKKKKKANTIANYDLCTAVVKNTSTDQTQLVKENKNASPNGNLAMSSINILMNAEDQNSSLARIQCSNAENVASTSSSGKDTAISSFIQKKNKKKKRNA